LLGVTTCGRGAKAHDERAAILQKVTTGLHCRFSLAWRFLRIYEWLATYVHA
jgi:hypothetical protein